MTTPHKALLIQARDALRLSATPLAKDRQEVLQAIAALQAAIDAPEPEPSRWHESTAELAAIYGEMCAIRATESKQTPLTQQQEARLVALRAECIALNYRRIAMVKEAPKPKPSGYSRFNHGQRTAIHITIAWCQA